jgi:hypothetical protein
MSISSQLIDQAARLIAQNRPLEQNPALEGKLRGLPDLNRGVLVAGDRGHADVVDYGTNVRVAGGIGRPALETQASVLPSDAVAHGVRLLLLAIGA